MIMIALIFTATFEAGNLPCPFYNKETEAWRGSHLGFQGWLVARVSTWPLGIGLAIQIEVDFRMSLWSRATESFPMRWAAERKC